MRASTLLSEASPLIVGPCVDFPREIWEEFASNNVGAFPTAARRKPCLLSAVEIVSGYAFAHVLGSTLALSDLFQDKLFKADRRRLEGRRVGRV